MTRTRISPPRRLWLALLLAVFASATVLAQRGPTEPPRGSLERKAIMDALRAAVLPQLKQNVIFEVSHLQVQDGYAFLIGVPRRADGTAIDYRGTKYQEAINEGMFDDWIYALLARVDGRWRTLDFGIGATDVAWLELIGKHGAPHAIFPEHGDEHDHH